MFNSISKHFQSQGVPEKLAEYMSDFLTQEIHHHAIVLAEILREEFGEPECDCDNVCKECQEAELKKSLHEDIAKACNMPVEVVDAVMAGQDEVLLT